MNNVINIFDYKKTQNKEKKEETTEYNFVEIMQKNKRKAERLKQERIKNTQKIADKL